MNYLKKKISRFILRLLYALPFGVKGADNEIMGVVSASQDGNVTVQQTVQDHSVAKHLLKGEITQAVEELRYRMYKVAHASENYEYLGDGIAVKTEEKKRSKTKFRFIQENKANCATILEEFEHIGEYTPETYRVEITYNSFPVFKIEEFIDSVSVSANTETEEYFTELRFSMLPNPFNHRSKPFIKELEKLLSLNLDSEYAVSHNRLLSDINSLSFTTYKASNEDDFVNYSFLGEFHVQSVKNEDNMCILTIKWETMLRVMLNNFEEKYYSESMEEKYRTKAPKINNNIAINKATSDKYCPICGSSMNADAEFCDDCVKKINK